MEIKITIRCSMCLMEHETTIVLPEGWKHRYGGLDDSDGFCPKHSKIAEWTNAQCPGCVSGWRDCGLWDAFAYSSSEGLTTTELSMIRQGICPKRVNGSIMISNGIVSKVDLSETAPADSGIALADAIQDYIKCWGTQPDHISDQTG